MYRALIRDTCESWLPIVFSYVILIPYAFGYTTLSDQRRYEGHYFWFVNKRTFESDLLVYAYAPMAWTESRLRCECTSLHSPGKAEVYCVSPFAYVPRFIREREMAEVLNSNDQAPPPVPAN